MSQEKLAAYLASIDADYAQYAGAFMAAGFRTPKELATLTEADVPDVPKGAARFIAKTAAAAQPSAAQPEPQQLVAARARTASKYRGYTRGVDNKPRAVTILDPRHVITCAHGSHTEQWHEGDSLEVFLNDPQSDKPASVKVKVLLKKPRVDVVVMEVVGREPLDAPALDADVHPGEPYIMVGYSSTSASSARGATGKPALEDSASVVHGSIATSLMDSRGHIRGDTPSSPGDSGAGVFSLETGKLIAMNVGREKIKGPDGQEVDGFKSVLVPVTVIMGLLAGVDL